MNSYNTQTPNSKSLPLVDFSGSSWWWVGSLVTLPNQYVDFGLDLHLDSTEDAWIAATCGSWFTLWVNGHLVAHGPLREVAPWQYYECNNIKSYLVVGLNRIRIRAYHYGIATQSHEPCLAGLMIRGDVIFETHKIALENHPDWKARLSPHFLPGAPRLHHCNGFGEHVRLEKNSHDWLSEDLDGTWETPTIVGVHPLKGREKLMPRDIPQFVGEVFSAVRIDDSEEWQVWDFGGEVFGFISLNLEAKVAGTCNILHGESLNLEGLPDHRYSGGDFREILEMPVGVRVWAAFDKRALRYMALPKSFNVLNLTIRESHWPLTEIWQEQAVKLNLNDRDMAIIKTAARTVILCCDDLINDCPRRERGQYSDSTDYMEAFPLLFGTWEPIRRWFRQFQRGASENGVLRMCYPSSPNQSVIPDYSIGYAGRLRGYFEATKDMDTLLMCYNSAYAGTASFECYEDAQGLLANVPGWIFLCNSFELAKHPRSAALNALWVASWHHLSVLAKHIGDSRSTEFQMRYEKLRASWRNTFYKNGRILDADRSEEHERQSWWNYHYEADRGHFYISPNGDPAFILKLQWLGRAKTLVLTAAGRVRVWARGILLLDKTPESPWSRPHPFHPWECQLPENFGDEELLFEVGYNTIDWEIYVNADSGCPGESQVAETTNGGLNRPDDFNSLCFKSIAFRTWSAPKYNQITTGYAVESGMFSAEESVDLLRKCLREEYNVPWLKRTTPLICKTTMDKELIRNRVVLCNTPQSLSFFCRSLKTYGLESEARKLCVSIYGSMIDAGATSLWEEFAPRSSLCHAWSAMCVEYLLSHSSGRSV